MQLEVMKVRQCNQACEPKISCADTLVETKHAGHVGYGQALAVIKTNKNKPLVSINIKTWTGMPISDRGGMENVKNNIHNLLKAQKRLALFFGHAFLWLPINTVHMYAYTKEIKKNCRKANISHRPAIEVIGHSYFQDYGDHIWHSYEQNWPLALGNFVALLKYACK